MNIQGAGLDLIRNPDKLYDWMGLKQSPGKVETTQTTKAPFVQKPKKEKDLFLEGFYSVADKPKEERRSYTSPLAKSRAILDSMSQTKPAKRVVEEEDDFLKGFYSVADRPKEETPISAQPQTTYKPGDWIRSTMAQPNLWNGKNADLSPQKVNYASSINARTGESRDEYDSRVRSQYAVRRQAEEDARYADYDIIAARIKLNDYDAWTDKLIESRKAGNGFAGDYDVAAERNALEAEIKKAKAAQARNLARKYASIPDPGVVLGDGGIYISALENPEHLHYITPEETRKYAYLKVKEGVSSANEYLNYLEPQLIARKGAEIGQNVVDGGALIQIPYRAFAGLESYGRNISQLMTEEAVPLSATAYANQYIRENTDGVGRFVGDLSYGLGNIAPSVAAGIVNPWLGKISFGASAYGGAYNSALLEGRETGDARTYAALSTASELAMQHVLGGISALGGKTSLVNLSENLINKIGNVNLRLTAQLGNRMLGEGAEEGLQTYMEAALRNVLFDEDYNLRDVSEEALYNSMLGAVTAFVTESPEMFSEYAYSHLNDQSDWDFQNQYITEGSVFNGKGEGFGSDGGKIENRAGHRRTGSSILSELGKSETELGRGSEVREDIYESGLVRTRGLKANKPTDNRWQESDIISVSADSVVGKIQSKVMEEYGIDTFVVRSEAWAKSGKKAPAYSKNGQIYLRENLSETEKAG